MTVTRFAAALTLGRWLWTMPLKNRPDLQDKEELRTRLEELVNLMNKHGPKSDEVREFVREHSERIEDFKDLALAMIALKVNSEEHQSS